MENNNFDTNLAQIKMEKAKAAASMLNESWGGASKASAAGSYVDGVAKEIEQASKENNKVAKPSFSLGVLETAMALRNTAFAELSEGKILADKYINAVSIKGISEAFLLESMIQELDGLSWEVNAKASLANLKKTYESNRREIAVVKAMEEINRSGGRDLFSSVVESMKNWVNAENKVSESLIKDLKQWAFNPIVRNLFENLAAIEAKSPNKFEVKVNSNNCTVNSIIAPTLVSENYSVFVTSNRFFKSHNGRISILERAEASKLPSKFLSAVINLTDSNVKVSESGADLYIGKNKISVVLESETETKSVYLNGRRISPDQLGFVLSMELRNTFNGSADLVKKAVGVVEAVDYLAEVDFGKKIVSNLYEGVEANIFKMGDKVYVHKVNPAMKKNDLFEGNGNQAVNIVKEFLGFDLSESMADVLGKEDRILAIMRNDKEAIKKNLEIVESEIAKINIAIKQNPLIQESSEIKEAQAMLQVESNTLKSKWNQITVEIERFEKGHKKVSVNENQGYAINTDIKVKRSGERGKVVGVNGNSKTYTVMFENGKTGEFFFSDVMDTDDEISDVNLEVSNEIDAIGQTNEKQDMNLAEAPSKGAKSSAKNVDDLAKHNLATLPKSNAASAAKDIDDLGKHNLGSLKVGGGKKAKETVGVSGDMNLAKLPFKGSRKEWTGLLKSLVKGQNLATAPGGKAKDGASFIQNLEDHQLAESQANQHVEKAPKGKSEKPKKFVENLDDAELAEAPGNHNKNGKKDHEPLNRAGLAKAPKARTKKK